jgi:hypothetical protein
LRNTPLSAIIYRWGAGVKIGIISDTHDNLRNLEEPLEILWAEGVTKILRFIEL